MNQDENQKEENQNPNGNEPAQTEDGKGFQSFVSTAMRTARKGIREQLMADLLIRANISGSPLVKIQAICDAAGMSEKKAKIDMNLVELASMVSISLMNTEKSNISAQSNPRMIRCSWAFKQTEENYKKYIEPWQSLNLRHYSLYTRYVSDNYSDFPPAPTLFSASDQAEWCESRDEILEEVEKWLRKLSNARSFYEQTYALSRLSFSQLEGEFEVWAMMQLRPIAAIIAGEINPEVYKDVLTALMQKGKKEGEEQESESALG